MLLDLGTVGFVLDALIHDFPIHIGAGADALGEQGLLMLVIVRAAAGDEQRVDGFLGGSRARMAATNKFRVGEGDEMGFEWDSWSGRRVALYIANFYRLAQRRHWIAHRHEFLAHKTLVTGFQDGAHHRGVIDFLRLVNFIAARISRRVIMRDVRMILPDARDQVAVHDLDVIEVEENLDALGADLAADFDRRFQMVGEIIRVPAHVDVHAGS